MSLSQDVQKKKKDDASGKFAKMSYDGEERWGKARSTDRLLI